VSVRLIQEEDIEELALPGRQLRWLADSARLAPQYLSSCVVRIAPGQKVKPAHSHPNGEELIYVMSGSGRVLVDGCVEPVKIGTTVLFPRGSIHMLQNTGDEEMKVICFYAPPSDLSTYQFHEEVDFPT
jgi:quercetin dioxygenase-like cupin family protein